MTVSAAKEKGPLSHLMSDVVDELAINSHEFAAQDDHLGVIEVDRVDDGRAEVAAGAGDDPHRYGVVCQSLTADIFDHEGAPFSHPREGRIRTLIKFGLRCLDQSGNRREHLEATDVAAFAAGTVDVEGHMADLAGELVGAPVEAPVDDHAGADACSD